MIVLYIVHSIFHYFIDGCAGGRGALALQKVVLSDLDGVRKAFKIKTVDPYLIIQYDSSLKRTSTMHIDAAEEMQEASWNDLDVEFPISQSSISDGHKLMIAVMDDNIGLKDNHIGKVEVSLDDFGVHLLEAGSFSIPEIGNKPLPLKARAAGNAVLGYLALEFELVCRDPISTRQDDPYVIKHKKYNKDGEVVGEGTESDFTPDPNDIRMDSKLDSSNEVDDGDGERLIDEIEDESREDSKGHEAFMDKEEGRNSK